MTSTRLIGMNRAVIAACCAVATVSAPAQSNRSDRYVTRYSELNFDTAGMPLGPTGAWGYMHGESYIVSHVSPGSPADGVLAPHDVVIEAGGTALVAEHDPRVVLGRAITRAESQEGRGRLELRIDRDGRPRLVTVRLEVLGQYAKDWPDECAKSRHILRAATDYILRHGEQGGVFGATNALAMLADDSPETRDYVRRYVHFNVKEPRPGEWSWGLGYNGVLLGEYYLSTGDASILPKLKSITDALAAGQLNNGSWSHALPEIGEIGYGPVNQTGLVCCLAMVLAKECGVAVDEVRLKRSLDFFRQYAGRGWIPYGDHPPYMGPGDNGKNSIAAVIYDLLGEFEVVEKFARSVPPSWPNREFGHTGHYFSLLWGPLGAVMAPRDEFRSFMDNQAWYYDLLRTYDGGLVCIPTGESGFAYRDARRTTGGLALTYALPLKSLRILGGDASSRIAPTRKAIQAETLVLVRGNLKKGDPLLAWEQIEALRLTFDGAPLPSEFETIAAQLETDQARVVIEAGRRLRNLSRTYRQGVYELRNPRQRADLDRVAQQGGYYGERARAVLTTIRLPDVELEWTTLLPAGADEAPEWRAAMWQAEKPAEPPRLFEWSADDVPEEFSRWYGPNYRDDAWQIGATPFSPGKRRGGNTDWKGNRLLLRTNVMIADPNVHALRFKIWCAEGTQIFLNGNRIFEAGSWTRGKHTIIPLRDEAAGLLRRGRNVIAVYAERRHYGVIDVGLEAGRRKTGEGGSER